MELFLPSKESYKRPRRVRSAEVFQMELKLEDIPEDFVKKYNNTGYESVVKFQAWLDTPLDEKSTL